MRFAVIGDPVAHSLSPAMHSAAYRALGLDHSYERLHVTDLEVQIDAIKNFDGINITVPHKESITRFCEPDAFAKRAGSVNTVDWRTGAGINTDGPGFLDNLPEGVKTILILGAGGTTRSIALALDLAGFDVTIFNRTRERAERLVSELDISSRVSSIPELAGVDVIVNATSAGLKGERLPLDWGRVQRHAVAIELAYGKDPTPFELDAATTGLKAINGRELLIAQGARSFEWWLGIPAPIEAMRGAVYGESETETK